MRPSGGSRRIVLLFVPLLAAFAGAAHAQPLGYGVGGLAGLSGFFSTRTGLLHVGGGGEALFGGMAGVGAEGGIFGDSGSMLVMVSTNGVLHVPVSTSSRAASPFVTAGYTLMGIGYGEGSFSAWNIGGGVDNWMSEHAGVRVEFRDHVRPDRRGTVHYWVVRVGLCIR